MLSLAILGCYTIVMQLLSHVTLQSIIAASAVEQSSFFNRDIIANAIIVQPYYLHNYFKCMFRVL